MIIRLLKKKKKTFAAYESIFFFVSQSATTFFERPNQHCQSFNESNEFSIDGTFKMEAAFIFRSMAEMKLTRTPDCLGDIFPLNKPHLYPLLWRQISLHLV